MLRRVENAHYWIRNMDESVAFYRDVLGLELATRAGEDWAEFQIAGSTIALHGTRPGHSAPQEGATVVFEVEDLDVVVRALRERNVDFVGEISETPTGRFTSFRDPDGNLLQIFQRTEF